MAPEAPAPVPETVPNVPGRYTKRWPTSGRKAQRNEMEKNWKVAVMNTNDSSRLVKMAPRSLRRERQGAEFRPVYHHGIPTKVPHKAIIKAMGIIDRKAAAAWQSQLDLAHAFVSFGLGIKQFLKNIEDEARDLRHATLKAEGKWITHAPRNSRR